MVTFDRDEKPISDHCVLRLDTCLEDRCKYYVAGSCKAPRPERLSRAEARARRLRMGRKS